MSWTDELPQASFTDSQQSYVQQLEADLRAQLATNNYRLLHSLSVAHVAEGLALVYGADPFAARCAGILHDWEKAHVSAEDVPLARELGIDMGVDPELVAPLLHGKIAARVLPARYPELPQEVWQAIERHTTGAPNMTPLDMVVFVADALEPRRGSKAGLDALREQVGKVSLADLYFHTFAAGAHYVLETHRFLYPQTIELYNQMVLARRAQKG